MLKIGRGSGISSVIGVSERGLSRGGCGREPLYFAFIWSMFASRPLVWMRWFTASSCTMAYWLVGSSCTACWNSTSARSSTPAFEKSCPFLKWAWEALIFARRRAVCTRTLPGSSSSAFR